MLTYPIVEILPLSEGIQSREKSHFLKRSLKFPKTQVQILEILPVVFQLLSRVPLFATAWTAAYQASLFFSISWSLLKLMSIESVMLSHYPILGLSILLLLENHTTGKTIALTIWTFISKVMSLLFNTLSRSVIALLPRSKHLLILWLQSHHPQ